MFGCWRKVDAQDPDTFITAVAAVLSDYPADVVKRVCDPRTGIPGKQQFPPSPFEVKKACEELMAPIRYEAEREARIAEMNRLRLPPPVRDRAAVVANAKARLGDNWGIQTDRPRQGRKDERLSPDEAARILGCTREEFDSIQNAPGRAA